LFVNKTLFYSPRKMKERTETLAVGDRAPDFTLPAVNREGTFSLSSVRQRGPVILEFLRGTW
jgi:peroxiredoxin